MKRPVAFLAIALATFLAACSQQPANNSTTSVSGDNGATPSLTPVTLMLNWYPEAEHGGYYAAMVHGYFEEQGLDVTIQPGRPNAPVIQQVARGEIEFGVINADRIILARAQDARLKGLFAPLANSPRCLLVHAESGIESFEQLKDVTLMMRRENAWAQFLINRLPLEGVDVVPNTSSLAPFLANKKAVKQGYIISEPFVAKSQGADVRTLQVAELGFNPYTSVLMARDELVTQQPQLVQKMVAASLQGWQKYLGSPAETNQRIHELNPEMDLEILDYGVQALKEHCVEHDSQNAIGAMTPDRWKTLVSQLEELEMITLGSVDAAELYLSSP